MRHSIHAEGFGLRLRPVRLEDAAFIVWLRNQDFVKGRIGDSETNVAGQETWLKKYLEREGDYYFIAETLNGTPVGTHGIYDVRGGSAEKGRHIVRSEVLAGVPAGLLATDLSFGELGLTVLRANCVSTNTQVRSLHLRAGFKEVGTLKAAQTINGQPVDLLQFVATVKDWNVVRDRIVPLARVAEKQITEWEKTPTATYRPWGRH